MPGQKGSTLHRRQGKKADIFLCVLCWLLVILSQDPSPDMPFTVSEII